MLLLVTVLLVFLGLVVLDIRWQQEWLSVRLSLWVSGQAPVPGWEPGPVTGPRTSHSLVPQDRK